MYTQIKHSRRHSSSTAHWRGQSVKSEEASPSLLRGRNGPPQKEGVEGGKEGLVGMGKGQLTSRARTE